MLRGGTAVGLIGLTQIKLACSDREINNTRGTVMFSTGLASSLASFPLFIASKRNRRMAKNLAFRPVLFPGLPGHRQAQQSQAFVHMKMLIVPALAIFSLNS
jgi:hypothetical protein